MARILTISPLGIQNLERWVRNARILRSSGQGSANWVDLVQFAVNFEGSIYRGVNPKMVCEFRIICVNGGFFGYLGGVRGFLTVRMCGNGADFTSFII